MPARGHHKTDGAAIRKVAEAFLEGDTEMQVLAHQHGIRRATLSQAVGRLRDERGIARPRKGGLPAKPTSLASELGARARQDGWLTCCQSADLHRFDCPVRPSGGPYLPVAPMTASQLERVRSDAARSAP